MYRVRESMRRRHDTVFRMRLMGAQRVRLTTTQFREFSVVDISFRCRRCASDDSGSAFDFVASLNRYAYTQFNYYWLCVYVLCTCF